MDQHFIDHHFGEISERLKGVTWLIEVSFEGNVTYGSGFAIKVGDSDSTVLMSCCHLVNTKFPSTIRVRRYQGQEFLEAEIKDLKPAWDVCLLSVKGANNDICAEFAGEGSISNGETLLHVGHVLQVGPARPFVWSFFVGHAVYQCVDGAILATGMTCGKSESSSQDVTPGYRTMGDIWNKSYFDAHSKKTFLYEKNLSAKLQIIQCARLCCKEGCAGGPVFNRQGRIVGMIVGECYGCQVAVHVAQLKRFVIMSSTTEDSSSSKAMKPLKRKGPSKSTNIM